MSILFNLEGPKGTGKTTIGKLLSEKYDAPVLKFDSDTIVRYVDFDTAKEKDVIFERGILSYQIYDWLWNNGISKKETTDFSTFQLMIKTPINQVHFDRLMKELTGKYIIFYSSDTNLLVERIYNRKNLIGKGANNLEWQTLHTSNLYFKYMGMFLKELYPEKVLLIDVNNNLSVEDIMNKIESEM